MHRLNRGPRIRFALSIFSETDDFSRLESDLRTFARFLVQYTQEIVENKCPLARTTRERVYSNVCGAQRVYTPKELYYSICAEILTARMAVNVSENVSRGKHSDRP